MKIGIIVAMDKEFAQLKNAVNRQQRRATWQQNICVRTTRTTPINITTMWHWKGKQCNRNSLK